MRNEKDCRAAAGLALSAMVAILLSGAPALAAGADARRPGAQEALRQAGALLGAGRTGEAIALLRETAAREPRNPTVHFALAGALSRARDYEGAIAALKAGLALAPHSLLARRALAGAQRKKGDLAAARATLEALWRDEPSFRPAGVDLAEVMAQQGDRREAVEVYRYLIDTYGPTEDARLAAIHVGLGKVLEAEGDRAGALAAYREALRIDPKHAEARAALARLSK